MNILYFIAALAVLVIILKILTFPIKLIFKFICNSIIGGIILYILAKIGIFVTITWWSILITGIFGIPGAIIAIIISMFI